MFGLFSGSHEPGRYHSVFSCVLMESIALFGLFRCFLMMEPPVVRAGMIKALCHGVSGLVE